MQKRLGRNGILGFSYLISALGMVWLAMLGANAQPWEVSAGLFISGIGWGWAFTPAASMGMAAVSAADEGFASGAEALARSLFGVIGIAVLGSLLAVGITAHSYPYGLHLAMYVSIGLTIVSAGLTLLLLKRTSSS